MGVGQSKGGVRWLLEPLVPRRWAELEQLHLRFQQEAYRRRADPVYQYFLPFPVFQAIVTPLCPDKDKLQLLAMFEALDRRKKRRLAAVDFFSGLVLLVDAKKPQKLEFVLSLLDNGGLKTLNRCELMMVVAAAARGLAMFAPGADVLSESTMKPLIRRMFGDENEVLRQTVVNKALADPEILFFMSDLEAGVATSSGELLAQQAKLLTHMAYLDYQAARVKTSEERVKANAAPPADVPSQPISTQWTRASFPTAESFTRKLQSIVCPPPPKGSGPSQSMRVISVIEAKRHVDVRTLQRLVTVASDRGLSVSKEEAEALLRDMAADQFGLVRCGDILRIMKVWLQNRRQENPEGLWEIIGKYVVKIVKAAEQYMTAALAAFITRTTKTLGPSARRRTTAAKDRLLYNLLNAVQNPDTDDGELQWSVSIRVGETVLPTQEATTPNVLKPVRGLPRNNIRFRLGIHPPGTTDGDGEVGTDNNNKSKKDGQLDYDSDDNQPEEESDTMRLIVQFLLNPEITDEEGIDLASSMERALQHDLVWASFASLWTKCSVTMGSALRSEGNIRPTLAKFLRVCIDFRDDFFSSVEECTGTSLAAGFRSFFVMGELDQSLGEIVKSSQDMEALLRSLGKRTNRERAMRMIFEAFDAGHSGVWSLQEFNTFQQALGKEALLEPILTELFGGTSTISFKQFVTTYENLSAAKLLEMICQLGIGSLGDLVTGSVSITSVLNEPCVTALGVLLSPLRWADTWWKKLLFISKTTKDLSLELQFPKLAALVGGYFGQTDKLNFLREPLFVASWMECLEEFLQPSHSEHFKDRPCRSILCSLERDTCKTQQQWEFDDQSRKLPRGTSARRAEAMVPFLEMARLVKAHVRGPELVEVRSNCIRIVLELDNLWMERSSPDIGSR